MLKNTTKFAGALALALAVASCGGGGDIAGDSTEFSVSPDEYALKVGPDSNGGCSGASSLQPVVFTIIGGQAPFRIVNSDPQALQVDKTEATGKDPKFQVKYRNTSYCANPAVITVLDYHSRVATVEISVEVEEEEETTPAE